MDEFSNRVQGVQNAINYPEINQEFAMKRLLSIAALALLPLTASATAWVSVLPLAEDRMTLIDLDNIAKQNGEKAFVVREVLKDYDEQGANNTAWIGKLNCAGSYYRVLAKISYDNEDVVIGSGEIVDGNQRVYVDTNNPFFRLVCAGDTVVAQRLPFKVFNRAVIDEMRTTLLQIEKEAEAARNKANEAGESR